MNKTEEKMLALRLDNIMAALESQAREQGLKDENIMGHLTVLSARVEANMDLVKYITDKDRELLIETRDNTRLTNGRVTKLELDKNEHIINCPLKKELDSVKKSIEDLTFVQRHPIFFVALCISAIFVMFYFKSLL